MNETTVRELFPAVAAYADAEKHLTAEVENIKARLRERYQGRYTKDDAYARSLAIWPRETKRSDTKQSMVEDLADHDAERSEVAIELRALSKAAEEAIQPVQNLYWEMRSTRQSLQTAAFRLAEDLASMQENLAKGWVREPSVAVDGVNVDKYAMLLRFQWDTARGLLAGNEALQLLLQTAISGDTSVLGTMSLTAIVKIHRAEQQAQADAEGE